METKERVPVVAVKRDAEQITINLHGSTKAPIVVRFAQLSDAVRAAAFGYGMEVRLTRAAALTRDTKSGKSATPDEKHEAIRKLAEHYASGAESWAMAREGGGGLSADTRALIDALVAALGLDPDVAEEQVRAMTSAERDALRVDAEIKPHLDAIYAERGKAAGDAKALLEKLRKAGFAK